MTARLPPARAPPAPSYPSALRTGRGSGRDLHAQTPAPPILTHPNHTSNTRQGATTMARYHGRHRRPGRVARILATLDRPHSRQRRTARRNLARLATWPVAVVVAAVIAIGFTQPDTLTGVAPAQRVVIER